MGRADLHIHSAHSDGMATVREIMTHAEQSASLDVLAIADHDQVAGALEAVEWCAGHPGGALGAVVGTEISAAWGRHVLALFFHEPFPTQPFPRFRPLAHTIRLVEDAGGVVVAPHPLSALVPSIGERTLRGLLAAGTDSRALVGVEICSGVVGGRAAEPALRRLNDSTWRLAEVGSSDAHHLQQIGSAYTEFPGRSVDDLERALLRRGTRARWGPVAHIPLGRHARQGWRSLVVKPVRELRALPRTLMK